MVLLQDYVRLFGAKCDKCHLPFSKEDYVMRAQKKIFHLNCFKCVACGKTLTTGEFFALKEEGLYCNEHHKLCDKLESGAGDRDREGGENNNNKNILNHNRELSEDGDDKSEEGKKGQSIFGQTFNRQTPHLSHFHFSAICGTVFTGHTAGAGGDI